MGVGYGHPHRLVRSCAVHTEDDMNGKVCDVSTSVDKHTRVYIKSRPYMHIVGTNYRSPNQLFPILASFGKDSPLPESVK